MRSFSNIMPNFADKLHLLVDSIYRFNEARARHFRCFIFGGFENLSYLCRINQRKRL